jgi:hypothetical protein
MKRIRISMQWQRMWIRLQLVGRRWLHRDRIMGICGRYLEREKQLG